MMCIEDRPDRPKRRTYQPVVVRKPCGERRTTESVNVSHEVAAHQLTRAREGRGFLGLARPVDDSGITDDVAHADCNLALPSSFSSASGLGLGRSGWGTRTRTAIQALNRSETSTAYARWVSRGMAQRQNYGGDR